MTIGELYINLGLKGSDKTLGALGNVKKGLGDLAGMSLEAKAGIVAAMYALEKLFATSGAAGTGLTNFNSLLGVSAQTLQKYQYAARQMGVSNEETASSFKALQSAMTKTLMGEGAPKGMARLSLLTGGINPEDIAKFQKNPELLMQRLQQYALKEKHVGMRNEVLKSFGMSEGVISAMGRNAFRPEVMAHAPTYKDAEIGQLDKANIAWSNLGNKIEMAIGHFNAKHGVEMVQNISKIVDQVVKLVEAFAKLADKLKVFDQIGKAFKGWNMILGGANDVAEKLGDTKKRAELGKDTVQFFKEMPGVFKAMGSDAIDAIMPASTSPQAAAPKPPAMAGGTKQDINVQQTLQFQHDGKDHKKTGDSVKQAVKHAYFQMSAQGQGS